MRWQDFRAITDYQDRLVPGADRSMPGEYAPEGKVRPRDATARPLKSLPPTPLEEAENRRLQAEYIKQRSRQYGRASPDQPQYVGLPNSPSAEIGYLGVMQDYPDRAVQRDPGVRRYDDTAATPYSLSSLERPLWAQQFTKIVGVDPYEIGIGDPATAQAYLQAQRGRR